MMNDKKFKIDDLNDHQSLKMVFDGIQNKQIDIISYLNSLFHYFQPFIHNYSLIESFKTFLFNHEVEDVKCNNIEYIHEKVRQLASNNYYYFMELFSYIIKNFFDQNTIIKKYNQENINSIDDAVLIGDYYSSYKISVDKNCNFLFQKEYNKELISDVSKNNPSSNLISEINREQIILRHDFKNSNQTPIFIVHSNYNNEQDENKNKILFSYYPCQKLKQYLSQEDPNSTEIVKLSKVNKLVLILEIAFGIQQLHENNISHQNLCNTSIFVSSNGDAYIGEFLHDSQTELNQTKLVPQMYFRHPKLIKNNRNNENNIIYDIYSFGVLVYNIVTQEEPDSLFENATKKKRYEILEKSYIEFLFKKYENKNFDDEFEMEGVKELILNCMNGIFNDFNQVINYIKVLIEKTPYKEEIEYRIHHAIDPKTFKCTVCDLIFNYYYNGSNTSKELLKNFLNIILKDHNKSKNDHFFEKQDMITTIFDFFGFKKIGFDDDVNIFLDEYFDLIIRENVFSKINEYNKQFNFNDNDQKMMQLSINTSFNIKNKNKNEECINISNYLYTIPNLNDTSMIFPITTLNEFINNIEQIYTSNNNQNNLIEIILLYSYNLSKEVQMIHSYGLYHGDINEESIGIYYNSKEQIFIPSILLYYYYYQIDKEPKEKKKKTKLKDYEEYISKKQEEDVSKLLKIIKKLDPDAQIIPNEIYKCDSISDIVYLIYNTIISYISNIEKNEYIEENEKLRLSNRIKEIEDYSLYQLTFRNLANIYFQYKISEENYENIKKHQEIETNAKTFIDIYKTFKEILIFSNELLDIPNNNLENKDQQQNILDILNQIKQNNSIICEEYYSDSNNEKIFQLNITEEQNSLIYHAGKANYTIDQHNQIQNELCYDNNYELYSYYKHKKTESDARNQRIIHKDVFRTLEIQHMRDQSIEYLIKRYIKMLYPLSNFKVKLIIESKKYNFDKIKTLLAKLGHRCGFEKDNENPNKTNFFFYVNNIGSLKNSKKI